MALGVVVWILNALLLPLTHFRMAEIASVWLGPRLHIPCGRRPVLSQHGFPQPFFTRKFRSASFSVYRDNGPGPGPPLKDQSNWHGEGIFLRPLKNGVEISSLGHGEDGSKVRALEASQQQGQQQYKALEGEPRSQQGVVSSVDQPFRRRHVHATRRVLSEEGHEDMKAELELTARRLATEDGSIIITTTTKAMLHFVENWFAHMSMLGLDKHCLVFTYDAESYAFVSDRWPGQAVLAHIAGSETADKAGQTEGTYQYGDRRFVAMMHARPLLILALLDLGYSVLHSDTDIVYLRSPFPWFNDTRYSMFFSLDNFNGWARKPEEWDSLVPMVATNRSAPPNLCAGLMFLRPVRESKGLMQKWLHAMTAAEEDEKRTRDDQYFINKVLRQLLQGLERDGEKAEQMPYAMAGLPQGCFAPGWLVKGLVWWKSAKEWQCIVSLHFNYIQYKREKQLLMHRFKYWQASIGTPPQDLVSVNVTLSEDDSIDTMDSAALGQHALPKATNGTVVFTFVTEEHVGSFPRFWACLNRSQSAEHTVVFVNNQVMFQQVNEQHRGMPLLLKPAGMAANESADGLFKHKGLLPALFGQLLALNLTACYSDLHNLWLRWPIPSQANFDVLARYPGEVMASEMWRSEEWSWELQEHHKREATLDWLCIKPSEAGKQLVHDWAFATRWADSGIPEESVKKGLRMALLHSKGPSIRALSPWVMPPPNIQDWNEAKLEWLKSRIAILDVRQIHDESQIKNLTGNLTGGVLE